MALFYPKICYRADSLPVRQPSSLLTDRGFAAGPDVSLGQQSRNLGMFVYLNVCLCQVCTKI